MTKIQWAILDAISNSNGHITAEKVLAAVKEEFSTVSLSTVYRNLNIFAETGKIRRIQRASGADYYESNLTPHDHAYCMVCGNISDLVIPELKRFLKQNFDYHILSFDLIVNYVCPECAIKSTAVGRSANEEV